MTNIDRREFMRAAGMAAGVAFLAGCAPRLAALTAAPQSTPTSPPQPQTTVIPIDLEGRYIAYCGNNCEKCPLYGKECAKGCLGESCTMACSSCLVRRCAIRTKVQNCAYCDQYPCKTLEDQYENMKSDGYASWAKLANIVLENVKQAR